MIVGHDIHARRAASSPFSAGRAGYRYVGLRPNEVPSGFLPGTILASRFSGLADGLASRHGQM